MKRARCKRSAWFARNGFVRSTITWTTPSCGAPQSKGSLKRCRKGQSGERHYTRVLREDWSGAMVSVGSEGRRRRKQANLAAESGRGLLFCSVLPILLL